MKFSENNQSYVIIDKLHHQRENGEFCDVLILVRGQKVKAHRNVLAANSKYFNSLFNIKRVIKEKVNLEICNDVGVFLSLLNYMYTGIIVIDSCNVEDLMELCNHFEMENVMTHCEAYLREHLSTHNCFFTRNLAVQYKLSDLEKTAFKCIYQNIYDVMLKEEILHLSLKEIRSVLEEIKDTVPYLELFNFICKWVQQDENSRMNSFVELLGFLNCDDINSDWIEENVFLKNNQKCLYDLLNCMDENCVDRLGYRDKFELLVEKFRNKTENIHEKYPEEPIVDEIIEDKMLKNSSATNLQFVKTRRRRKTAHPRKVISEPKFAHRHTKFLRSSGELSRKFSTSQNIGSESPMSESNSGSKSSDKNTSKSQPKKKKCITKLNRTIECDKCSYNTVSPERLEKHAIRHHSLSAIYKCKMCDFESKSHPEHIAHLKTHYISPPFKCSDCDYSTDKIHYISSHLFIHTGDRPFACEQCDYKCITASVLKQHIRIQHTGETPFECTTCERKFTAKYLLKQHEYSHRKDKPFLCDHCGYGTKQKKLLSIHMRIHKGERLKCTVSGCEFRTIYRSTLSRHERIHSGVKSHVCSYCGASFFYRNYLIKHERMHLNVNPFHCDHCDFSSTRKEKLKEHLKRYHLEGGSSKGSFRSRKKRLMRVNDDNDDYAPLPCSINKRQTTSEAEKKQNSNDDVNEFFNASNIPQAYFNRIPIASHQARAIQQFQATYEAATANVQQTVLSNQIPTVPAMSHEIPTKFRSYMSFL